VFDTLLSEVMIDGIFHADPHPGNVLLLANGQLALLDFGSGTLTQLAPGFDILTDARRFTTDYLAAQLSPVVLRKTATVELISLVPMLRRLPRRLDRISASLEHGRLGLNVRLLADEGDRRYLTGLVHELALAFLAATLGVMSVLILGLHGGPRVTHSVTLYAFFDYCLLVFAGVLALRVLVLVFRSDTG